MKKFYVVIILLMYYTASFAGGVNYKTIGLINATANNLEDFIFLMQKKFIDIDSIKIIGVLHESQKEQLENSKQFVSNHGYSFVSFEIIHNEIPLDSMFSNNVCTNDFLKIFNNTDGLVFFGGLDILPSIYGEKTFITTDPVSEERNFEISFLYHLIGGYQNEKLTPLLEQRPDYLVLGICLGMQEINVASGGTLYQDIPYQIYKKNFYEDVINLPTDQQHRNYCNKVNNLQRDIPQINFHHLLISKNSFLIFDSLNIKPFVASAHHQSVKKTGKNIEISATSIDGKIVEAIINNKYPNVYGIQFHTDFPSLYLENSEFKVSSNQTLKIDADSKLFYINFWKDFSKRINNLKIN